MDEIGGDTNMVNDSAAAGVSYVGRKGDEIRSIAGKKGKRYTTIGLTALNGEPVMCIVIFAGSEWNLHMETGIDTALASSEHNADLDADEDDVEYFKKHYGEGNLFPGGQIFYEL